MSLPVDVKPPFPKTISRTIQRGSETIEVNIIFNRYGFPQLYKY